MYIDNYGRIIQRDELYHYGVEGMHWGVRRYQPYPGDYHGDGKYIGKRLDLDSGDRRVRESNAKAAAKELNDLDKQRVELAYKESKLMPKFARAVNKAARNDGLFTRRGGRIAGKYADINERRSKIEKKTNKIIEELLDKGYNVSAFESVKDIKAGKHVAEILLTTPLIGGFLVINDQQHSVQDVNKYFVGAGSKPKKQQVKESNFRKDSHQYDEKAEIAELNRMFDKATAMRRSGKTYAEIGEALGITADSVPVLLDED